MVRPTLPAFSVAPMRATDLGLKNVLSELRTGRGAAAGASWTGAVEVVVSIMVGRWYRATSTRETGRCSLLRGPGVTATVARPRTTAHLSSPVAPADWG